MIRGKVKDKTMAKAKSYSEKLKDPRWQKKRLEIFQRDNFTCQKCGSTDKTLVVHHFEYSGEPWDSENKKLITVCEICHDVIEEIKNAINTESPSLKIVNYESENDDKILGITSDKFSVLAISDYKSKSSVIITDDLIIKLQKLIDNYNNLRK